MKRLIAPKGTVMATDIKAVAVAGSFVYSPTLADWLPCDKNLGTPLSKQERDLGIRLALPLIPKEAS